MLGMVELTITNTQQGLERKETQEKNSKLQDNKLL